MWRLHGDCVACVYLSIHGLEHLADVLPLHAGAVAEDVYDGLLVGAHALHGLAESLAVTLRVKGWPRLQSALSLDNRIPGGDVCMNSTTY